MSSALAIAGVTYLLRDLLNDGLINHALDSNVRVSARPPLRDFSTTTSEQSQLNVFLYQVSPNLGWRNLGLPSRDSNGTRVANPPLALDLHYLVTAYDDRDFHAEVLLGYAMQLLHENPGLSRDQINKSLKSDLSDIAGSTVQLPPELKLLTQTDLASQFESLKITPHYLSTEEMSKLWTGLQAPYRPSMTYQVSVVLIESDRPARTPPPVRVRNLQAVPLAVPFLENLTPIRAAEGDTLTLTGANLSRPGLTVNFGDVTATPLVSTETHIKVKVPAGLAAGVNGVNVSAPYNFGLSTDAHSGVDSNALAFQLVPQVSPAAPAVAFTVAVGGTLKVAVTPAVRSTQKAQLLIGDAWSFTLPARDPASAPLAALSFDLPAAVVAGKYLLRLRVDGAESVLQFVRNPPNASEGTFTGPLLTVT